MAFDSQIIHWPTLSAFIAYLQSVPRPSWCKGLTNHNTYIPNETQWRGMASMRSMQATYITKGWPSGPNLYLAAEAPNLSDRGIWQMTPITHPGTHAGACNKDHLGIENVGDFDAAPPSEAQYALLLAVNRAILDHWGIPASMVNVHNECMAGRTCPGRYVTGPQLRADLITPLVKSYTVKHRYVTERMEDNGPPYVRELVSGEPLVVDKWYTNGRAHLASGEGFVDLIDLTSVQV